MFVHYPDVHSLIFKHLWPCIKLIRYGDKNQ